MASRRLISGALDGLLHVGDLRLRRVITDGGATIGQRDVHLLHSGDAGEHASHALHATFAVHAFDFQFDGFHRGDSIPSSIVPLTLGMATDVVCGMKVDPAKAGATVQHAGNKYYFCCKHCAAKFQAEPHKYLQPATDPVCGMKVEPANAAAEIEHAGRTFYFCSQGCAAKFNADPAKYVIDKLAAPAPAGTKFTCPMHPEIVQVGPGSCPKCGMALVPMEGGVQDDTELHDHAQRFWVSAALSIPLVFLAMAPMLGITQPLGLGPAARGYFELALATPVVLWGGWPFFRKFWLSLTNRSPNMYTLIGLGVGLAYLYSVAAVLAPALFPPEM